MSKTVWGILLVGIIFISILHVSMLFWGTDPPDTYITNKYTLPPASEPPIEVQVNIDPSDLSIPVNLTVPLTITIPSINYTYGETFTIQLNFSGSIPTNQTVTVVIPPHNQTSAPSSNNRVFTWVSLYMTDAVADWLSEEGFTDVTLYPQAPNNTTASVNNCYNKFIARNITFWYLVSFDFFIGLQDTSQAHLTDVMRSIATLSPNKHLYLDDLHAIKQYYPQNYDAVLNNLLNAIRTVKGEGITVITEFYGAPNYLWWSSGNFTGIDLDVYIEPSVGYSPSLVSLMESTNAESLGGYLWAWYGGWASLSDSQISSIYQQHLDSDFTRITAWTGYAPDYYNSQMDGASLYLCSAKWSEVKNCNLLFLEGEA